MKGKISLWLAGIGLTTTLLSASPAHAVSVFNGLYAWGRNNWGQLGIGDTLDSYSPIQLTPGVPGLSYSLAAGFGHNVVLLNSFSAAAIGTWGAGQYGQLGNGTIGDGNNNFVYSPAYLSLVPWSPPEHPVAAGAWHSVVTLNDNIFTFGYNYFGQLGTNDNTNYNTFQSLPPPYIYGGPWTDVAAGGHHTLALSSYGSYSPVKVLFTWGNNTFGQLGDGTYNDYNGFLNPVLASVDGFSAGGYHSAALTGSDLLTTGYNLYGQLGDGTRFNNNNFHSGTPVLTGVSKVSCGAYHTLALMNDGTVQACGRNNFGQLGDGTIANRDTWVRVIGLSNIIAISAGGWHSIAVSSSGAVYTWGYNAFGQLGDGTNLNNLTPYPIGFVGDTTNFSISAGWYHSLLYAGPGGG